MFSPFRDDRGRPLGLHEITYADLAQLADMDEGYVLEFKRSFTASVKAKVPRRASRQRCPRSSPRLPTRAAAGS